MRVYGFTADYYGTILRIPMYNPQVKVSDRGESNSKKVNWVFLGKVLNFELGSQRPKYKCSDYLLIAFNGNPNF